MTTQHEQSYAYAVRDYPNTSYPLRVDAEPNGHFNGPKIVDDWNRSEVDGDNEADGEERENRLRDRLSIWDWSGIPIWSLYEAGIVRKAGCFLENHSLVSYLGNLRSWRLLSWIVLLFGMGAFSI